MTLLKRTLLLLMSTILCHTQMMAQDKIVNPEISYAGSQRTVTIGGIAVNGIEGYEDYMLLSIGGLAVGETAEAAVVRVVSLSSSTVFLI